jgi:Glycoside hydrolase family 44
VSSAATATRTPTPFKVAESIYDGKLSEGWEDWGWGSHKLDAGPAKLVFGSFGGFALHHAELPSRFGGVVFRINAPKGWPQFLNVALKAVGSSDLPVVEVRPEHVAELDGGWREVWIGWGELNPAGVPFDRFVISARVDVGSDWVLLDKIALTEPGADAPRATATRNDKLSVTCTGPTHAIDPMIYGAANADWSAGASAQRIGGNTLSRTNWDLGVWNAGSDWFFRNTGGKSGSVFDWVEDAAKQGRSVALVVPMLGWVAKDATSFAFPRAKFLAQRKYEPDFPEAGDGYDKDGKPLTPGPPTLTSEPASPERVGGWVRKLVEHDKARGSRSVRMYILDNEPTLWDQTHRDLHPRPLSYDELLDRTLKYGAAVREADPDAQIAGPAEWGWTGYQYSAVDREAGWMLRPDRRMHSDLALIPWYLQQLAEHEKQTRQRLLDVVDVHFYPAAEGVYGGSAKTDPTTSELRIRSTRALWDPTYKDESWINETIRLIPRLKEWIATNYPGRRTSLGEWGFGADDHISGGLASAEALGRFGQQGLDAAFYWNGPRTGTATYWAFRAFRNFDGHGGAFLDTALATRESDRVSLFASRDQAGKHLVLVLVNRDPVRTSLAKVKLEGCGEIAESRMFAYSSSSTTLAPVSAPAAGADGLSTTLPAYSFAVVSVTLKSN